MRRYLWIGSVNAGSDLHTAMQTIRYVVGIVLLAVCASCNISHERQPCGLSTACRMENRTDCYARVYVRDTHLRGLDAGEDWDMMILDTSVLYDLRVTLHQTDSCGYDSIPFKTFERRQKFPSGVYYRIMITNIGLKADIFY